MELVSDLKSAICSLFEVHTEKSGVQRVITPIEYPGSGDRVVVRIRPVEGGFQLDENGEAALYANMAGGDSESDGVDRWATDLSLYSPVKFDSDNQTIRVFTSDSRLVAPYIFRVAEAAQQLFSITTARVERHSSDFKERVASVIMETAKKLSIPFEQDFELPIAGGMVADHYLPTKVPLIIITATSSTRLLEAEVIHMQYQIEQTPGFVLAIAESQSSVGKKQFERANYYTGKTVSFNPNDLRQMITQRMHQT